MRRAGVLVVLALAASLLAAIVPSSGASADIAAPIAPNSGLPGSTCQGVPLGTTFVPPGAGITTTGLGPDAPAYYEVGSTTGAFAGKPPKGIMIVIHGGGWYVVGKQTLVSLRPYVDHWRARGWQTVSIDYRGCSQSIGDVLWFMQRIRQLRPNAVICASGISAGGHLALLLASVRKDLACAISMAGPSDLAALAQQQAYDPVLGLLSPVRPTRLFNGAVAAFGASPSPLIFNSPIAYVAYVKARILLVGGEHDPIIPAEQNANYAAALKAAQPNAYVDTTLLPVGSLPFVHSGISQTGMDDLNARELALVAPFG